MLDKITILLAIMLPFTAEYIPGGRFYLGRKKVKEIKKEFPTARPLTTKEYLERL